MPAPKDHKMRGKVIALRPVVPSDYPKLGGILNDRETMSALIAYFKTETWTPESIQQRYERFQKGHDEGTGTSYAVEFNETGEVVGECGFNRITTEDAEFGIIIDRAVWGKGVARECFLLCYDYGFGEMGLKRIYCTTDDKNLRMKAFLAKIGIPFLRQIDERSLYYEISAGEWLRQKAGTKEAPKGARRI